MNKILQGDSLEILKTLPDESIDCVMTSPPYWALRDYGVAGQLGLEPTFEEYINKLCNIFDEVKRVLKKEGTCWVNIGDSYSGTGDKGDYKDPKWKGRNGQSKAMNSKTSVPSKSLCMIPSRFSIEMVNRGWILRNEIIWHKPNCMPESVTDRFTNDFEKLFFFVKSKKYWSDMKAVAEPITDSSAIRLLQDIENQKGSERANGGNKTNGNMKAVSNLRFGGNKADGYGVRTKSGKAWRPEMAGSGVEGHSGYKQADGSLMIKPMRNKRTVWKIEPKGFREAHFAVYPEKLCVTPILAGCPEGGIVLDPFMGSGTTCKVARDLGRKYLGIELNPDYIKIANKRLAQKHLFETI